MATKHQCPEIKEREAQAKATKCQCGENEAQVMEVQELSEKKHIAVLAQVQNLEDSRKSLPIKMVTFGSPCDKVTLAELNHQDL